MSASTTRRASAAGAATVRKLVIPVAGLGTRGLPYTKEVPKEFLPVLEVPTIQFIVEEALDAGIEQIIFVTGRGKHALEDYFDYSPGLEGTLRARGKTDLADELKRIGGMVEVISVRQKEPRGLGHAVACAAAVVGDEPFAVCLGDEIFPPWGKRSGEGRGIQLLCKAFQDAQKSVIGVMEIPKEDTGAYGIVDVGGAVLKEEPMNARRAVEKPVPAQAPSRYAIIGRYVFVPEAMDILKQLKPGVGGEIQLTDAINVLAERGGLQAMLLPGPRYDIGSTMQFVLAQVDSAMERPELRDRLKAALKERLQR